jgi:peptidoglycan/LPS O-acetylase OafA/YrhL
MSSSQTTPTDTVVLAPAAHAREERIHALDNLRALAMFLGIVLHAAVSFMAIKVPWAARDVSRHWTFDVMVGLIHGFRMQLFFFIAGFFARLLYERLGPEGFAKHRLKRVGLPFLVGLGMLVPMVGGIWIWGMSQATEPMELPFKPRRSFAGIPTGHLWFLEYLLVLYALALVVVWLVKRLPADALATADRAFDWLMRSPLKALLLALATALCLQSGPIGALVAGEVEQAGMSIIPSLRVLAYFGLFFVVGWWLHRRRHNLSELSRFLKSGLALALVAMIVNWIILASQPKPEQPNFALLKLAGLSCAALYAWLMTFAITGWFLRFAGQHQPLVRYLADASYWCYLAHVPLVLWLQIMVAQWPLNAWVKFAFINALTMALLVWSYDWFVRYSFIGATLNGRRERSKTNAGL